MDKEKLVKLKKDIEDLSEKLLSMLTKSVYKKEGMGEKQTQIEAELERKKETRTIRSLLKEKIISYELLLRAEEIMKEIGEEDIIKEIDEKGKFIFNDKVK